MVSSHCGTTWRRGIFYPQTNKLPKRAREWSNRRPWGNSCPEIEHPATRDNSTWTAFAIIAYRTRGLIQIWFLKVVNFTYKKGLRVSLTWRAANSTQFVHIILSYRLSRLLIQSSLEFLKVRKCLSRFWQKFQTYLYKWTTHIQRCITINHQSKNFNVRWWMNKICLYSKKNQRIVRNEITMWTEVRASG